MAIVLFTDDLELYGVGSDARVTSAPVGEQEEVEAQLGHERAQRGVDAEQVFDEKERHVVAEEAPEVDADGQVGNIDKAHVQDFVQQLQSKGSRQLPKFALAQLEQGQGCTNGN